jgi:hypothetical protein
MPGHGRALQRFLRWVALLLVWWAALLGMPGARAQEAPLDTSPPTQGVAEASDPARANPDPTAPATGSPAATTPAAATGAPCAGAYGLYADSSGRYTAGGCAAAGATSGPALVGPGAPLCQPYPAGSASAVSAPLPPDSEARCPPSGGSYTVPNGQVAPCQLFASGSQPTTSSVAAPATGAPLTAAVSVAPPCQPASSGRAGPAGNGVPACQLYPSASQPTSSSFGAANYPVTPVPAPAQVAPARATLAGAGC